jgi:L-arabinonolactonase
MTGVKTLRAVSTERTQLGECPIWSIDEQALYFVDIYGPKLHRLGQDLTPQMWTFAEPLGAFALRRSGGALITLKSGPALFNFETGDIQPLPPPSDHPAQNRFNDGRCDARGRFWVGSMSETDQKPVGNLYRIDGDLTMRCIVTGLIVPNSIAFTQDGTKMFLADSPLRRIDSFSFELESGTLSDRRLFADVVNGYPDGSAMDAEGCLWNAAWDGWAIERYAPSGARLAAIPLPVQRPTMCAFGGPALRTLFITTASYGLTASELAAQPLAGHVLALDVDVAGLGEPLFAG